MRNTILGVLTGVVISLLGWDIFNWRFWVMGLWTGIIAFSFNQPRKHGPDPHLDS